MKAGIELRGTERPFPQLILRTLCKLPYTQGSGPTGREEASIGRIET